MFLLVAVGAAAAGMVAFLVGFLLARYRDIFFAMLSLAMSMILYGVLVKTETLGSTDGFHVESGTFLGYEPHGRALNLALFWLALGLSAVSAFLISLYFRTVAGALAMPVRDNEIASGIPRHLGHSPDPPQAGDFRDTRGPRRRTRGAGGSACGSQHGVLDDFGRIRIRHHPRRRRLGPGRVLGLPGVRAARSIAIDLLPGFWQLILGSALLLTILFLPEGLGSLFYRLRRTPEKGCMSAMLSVRDLEKTFGSIVAARDITLDVPARQTVGIIGANGAGKTTFINMITGHLTADQGHHQARGSRHHRPTLAQDHAPGHLALVPGGADFSHLHVFENMCAAAAAAVSTAPWSRGAVAVEIAAPPSGRPKRRSNCSTSLLTARPGVDAAPGHPQAPRHRHGGAGSPRVLLLDEPTSGISVEEKFVVMDVVMSALKAGN